MDPISIYHPGLDTVSVVQTEAQFEVLKESGWKKATKQQATDFEEARLAAERKRILKATDPAAVEDGTATVPLGDPLTTGEK